MYRWRRATYVFIGIGLVSVLGLTQAKGYDANNAKDRLRSYEEGKTPREEDEPKPSWPSPQSRCRHDDQCDVGLVCQPLDGEAVVDYLKQTPPEVVPPLTPLREGQPVCQSGCRINTVFRTPDEIDVFPNNCQSCQPGASTTTWTPLGVGTVCNGGSGDLCDTDEICSGDTGVCPEDTVAPTGTVCNPGSGDLCDADEVCSGVADQPCPYDTIASAGTICNPGSGDACDPGEVCSGIADEGCPEDAVAAAGTVCRPGSGDICDPDEVCSGHADEACPDDTVAASGTVCNPGSGDLCDLDEVCSGNAGEACPEDRVADAGTVCNEGSGDICDPDEVCSGNADESCPSDEIGAAGTVCQTGSGDACDPDEVCLGVAGEPCPQGTVADEGTECRAAVGPCDTAEVCDGTSDTCPAVDEQLCEDGSSCTADDQCVSGSCHDEVCGVPGGRGAGCDSDPDCGDSVVCDAGFCRSALNGACTDSAHCSGDLSCDVASDQCKLGNGATCSLDSECANGVCDPGTLNCRAGQNATCLRTEDCASGLICACDTFTTYPCPVGQVCIEDKCDPSGVCKVAIGGACALDSDCGIQQSIDYNQVHCPDGACAVKGWPYGRLCEVDPPPCPDCVGGRPTIGISANNDLCDSGVCFTNVGTPNNSNDISDPPDYVCCGDEYQACTTDEDCCRNWGFRVRGCGSQGFCIALSIAQSPDDRATLDGRCFTEADCIRDRGLICSADGYCIDEPPVPGPTADGDVCSVNEDCQSLHCAETRDDGRRCLPPNTAGMDGAGFGETCDGDGFLLAGASDGRQCTDIGGPMVCCSGGKLAQRGETGKCRQCCRTFDNEDPIGCKGIGDDEAVKRCVGRDGPTAQPCNRNRDCPSNHECIVAMDEQCCGGRCLNVLFDENNCGQCGYDCSAVSDANPCLTFDSCGGGRTPGVCEYSIPCEGEPGMGVGCYDSREDCPGESCSGLAFFSSDYDECAQNHTDCWLEPGEPVCYTFDRVSDTACDSCSSDDDCTTSLGEVCRSRCGGNKTSDRFLCFEGSYCAVDADPDSCD